MAVWRQSRGGQHGFCDIACINGLKARMPAADQRQKRQAAGHAGKTGEKAVLRPHDNRGPQNAGRRKRTTYGGLAVTLAGGIQGLRYITPEGADMNEAVNAGGKCGSRDLRGVDSVHALKSLGGCIQDTRQVHNRIRTRNTGGDACGIITMRPHGHDLSDVAARFKEIGFLCIAADSPHHPSGTRKGADNLTSDESGGSENSDYGLGHTLKKPAILDAGPKNGAR